MSDGIPPGPAHMKRSEKEKNDNGEGNVGWKGRGKEREKRGIEGVGH